MWRNYLLTARRALQRNPLYTAINVGGLTVGLACCILLALFVENEWTYDRFHDGADRLFRVNVTAPSSGGASTRGLAPVPLAPALAQQQPSVDAAVRVATESETTVETDAGAFEVEALYADSSFFDVLTFPARAGDPRAALQRPDGAVLTTRAAERLFGTADVVGRSLTVAYENSEDAQVQVGAVVAPPPTNSSVQFGLVLPFDLNVRTWANPRIWQFISTDWSQGLVTTFVRLADPSAAPDAADAATTLVRDRGGDDASELSLSLQPIPAMHLTPAISSPLPTRDPMSIYVLAALAGLLLLIACVNFTTLSLGQSVQRVHEVGVRKAIGAQIGQIRLQFWGEALLTCVVAFVLAVGAARLALPTFNALANETLTFDLLGRPWRLVAIMGIVAAAGVIAGGYPSLVVSRLAPSRVLRGQSSLRLGHTASRALMVAQFSLSIAFLAGALVMSRQIDFMQEKNLGFATENVVTIKASNVSPEQGGEGMLTLGSGSVYQEFRAEAGRLASVRGVTAAMVPVGLGNGSVLAMEVERPQQSGTVSARVNAVDTNFVDVMGIDVVAGRAAPQRGDPPSVVVNEAFVEAMGWDAPVGRTITSANSLAGSMLTGAEVVGVVANFHFRSLRHPITPLILVSSGTFGSSSMHVAVRVAPGPAEPALDALRDVWAAVAPSAPFDYAFLDERIDAQYAEEQRWQQITTWASSLALLIACAGLFGLATLAAQRRQREIGIRKALGATVTRILALVSKDFLMLVGVAFLVATPLAYLALQRWLETFAYRIELTGAWLAAAGLLTLAVAAVAVGTQALRAARVAPADVLRSE